MLAEPATRSITRVGHLWLDDFRCLRGVDVELDPGLTVIHGANGQGKTSLLEAVAWVARARSFRGVDRRAARARRARRRRSCGPRSSTSDRVQLFEAEIRASGRNRVQCNSSRSPVRRDLHGLLRVTVFAPDDLDWSRAARPSAATTSTSSSGCSRPATTRPGATSNGC